MADRAAVDAAINITSTDCPDRLFQCEPITVGVPLPRSAVWEPDRIGLVDFAGAAVALQARPTELWPDGSIRWALLDFQVTGLFVPQRRYRLELDRAAAPPSRTERLKVVDAPDRVVVDTGPAQFQLQRGIDFPFAAVTVNGAAAIDRARSALLVTDASGRSWRASITSVRVEDRGTLRSTVRLDGTIGPRSRPMMAVIARIQFFAGSAATRVAITLVNPRRARHRGGIWELGDQGSVYFKDAAISVALPDTVLTVECAPEVDLSPVTFGVPFELYQDSSGGENWRHITHMNRRHEVPCTFRGYRIRPGGRRPDGLRATPAVIARHTSGSAAIAVEHFWQNFPLAIEVNADSLSFGLWPGQFADLHELQGGEQKTHRFTLAFGDDAMARDAVFWGRMPAGVAAGPQWYCTSGAVAHLSPATADVDGRYRRLVNAALEGDHSFERKRETIDEYGWRNFGDIYADHENAFSGEPAPIVSHYNNQYDAVGGFACQLMRTGDLRWWRLMNELAMHVTDIDIYHTDRDKSAFNHGMFWHTSHYVPAGTSSHRSHPRHPRVWGGGPSNEHNYTAGLRLHWLLTGDPLSRDAAIGLAQWVIDMDDGRKTIFRWLSSSHTGLASMTVSPLFHGPGRGAGHSILALIDGHRLTGDRRFLVKADQLIRRCIHPADDIAALDLLDAERKWSYTAFLQALGKFLDYKAELGEVDRVYAYGHHALLHYAQWMADHEYPYLDKPETLEYPTETWAAQDMRKCEVFSFAAAHASGVQRERFLERAQFFFDYSVSALSGLETRTLARPVVLLLSNGFSHAARRGVKERPTPAAVAFEQFGMPAIFAAQKVIAKRRLIAVAGALAILAVLGVIGFLVAR